MGLDRAVLSECATQGRATSKTPKLRQQKEDRDTSTSKLHLGENHPSRKTLPSLCRAAWLYRNSEIKITCTKVLVVCVIAKVNLRAEPLPPGACHSHRSALPLPSCGWEEGKVPEQRWYLLFHQQQQQ